ncbi:predicted protein [Nematostella vectensis]|uniref:RWD domain-containing protein n=1 Tax=Nematostella vectensis TaxID=45351 RepID=A7RSN5_NEMVE|nr:predicted protein [Nematostella vectensis]|eukprot:XP_001637508.1 predicted protein [Nematostella vectensis]
MATSKDDENLVRQCEEVEALSAIYGEDFASIDESSRMYEIRIKSENDPLYSLTMQLLLPPQYPSQAPPVFEIHSVWMTSVEMREAMEGLYDIYKENQGEIVLYQWVEKLREMVDEKVKEKQKEETTHTVYPTDDKGFEATTSKDNSGSKFDYNSKNVLDASSSIEIIHGEPFTERKSTFQSHLAFVTKEAEVREMLHELKLNKKVAHATHNIMAYRIYNEERDAFIQDCDDDGESAAGSRLLHLLEILQVKNVVVVVSRWYGGILLGPDRFKHINNSARELIKSVGLLDKEVDEGKGGKTKGKGKSKKHK